MPTGAFWQAASSGTLMAAISEGRLVGYALYSLPRQVVRLTHLCVISEMRGYGIAKKLIDEISKLHCDRLGIVLRCRKDFEANNIWPHLGFEFMGEVPGRSRKRLPLCIWRRDHGHPDLFSTIESLGVLQVVLDLNVFVDIEEPDKRSGAIESAALTEDWLTDQVELVVTSELSRELDRIEPELERLRQKKAARRYHTLPSHGGALDATAQRITAQVARTRGIDLSIHLSDISDVRHLAEASLSGVTVLATRDEAFLQWSADVIDVSGVRVMRPADVILHVDELSRAQAYRPAEFLDTDYYLSPVRSRSDAQLISFLNEPGGERKSAYMARVHNLAAQGRHWDRMLLHSPRGEPIAFYVAGTRDSEMSVPILRAKNSNIETTIIRQMLALFRRQALKDKVPIVRVSDPALSRSCERALRENGFLNVGGDWIAFVVPVCADSASVDKIVTQAAQKIGLTIPKLCPNLSSVVAADLERTLWPAKIIDSELRSYLIPIRTGWASDLFGVPHTLMPRSSRLGMSCEHVYYRSPRPRVEYAPARLIWYATQSNGGLGAVIGCSRLEEVVSDKPAALYQQFRHLGVWRREQLEAAASSDRALALRFADTELFDQNVSLDRLRVLAARERQGLSLRSPQKISAQLFAAIYQEGHPGK
jgi:GNAT superfamily N-acetyltransferase